MALRQSQLQFNDTNDNVFSSSGTRHPDFLPQHSETKDFYPGQPWEAPSLSISANPFKLMEAQNNFDFASATPFGSKPT